MSSDGGRARPTTTGAAAGDRGDEHAAASYARKRHLTCARAVGGGGSANTDRERYSIRDNIKLDNNAVTQWAAFIGAETVGRAQVKVETGGIIKATRCAAFDQLRAITRTALRNRAIRVGCAFFSQ